MLADRAEPILDVGGGASTLVDGLLEAGYQDLTVLDVSAAGIRLAQERLDSRARSVTLIVTDLRGWCPQRGFALWHDRAVAGLGGSPAS